MLLYEGRQIFFGEANKARAYFENLGFICPDQQTTADFLTSMTSSAERVIRPGWEGKAPRSPDEFTQAWKQSRDRAHLTENVDNYLAKHPFHGDDYQNFVEARRMDQSSAQREKSPYTLSYMQQMTLTMWRSVVMLKTDPSLTATMLISNFLEALIISSVFYNLPDTTDSFDKRGLLLFFVILLNAFGSILEIMTLYAKRKVVEKHSRYALYHPSADALSSMIVDLPYKILNAIFVNTVLYFMSNLRREPGPYFFFLLISFTTTLAMSMLFRLLASVTKSIAQALAPATIMLLVLVLYTGYAIPVQYMLDWISWARWANPIFYCLESAMLNEFVGRNFTCSTFVPQGAPYESVEPSGRACLAQGSFPGENFVNGELYLRTAFGYENSHRWRNFGIIVVFVLGYMALHLLATEYIASERSKGEVLVFSRDAMAKHRRQRKLMGQGDAESGNVSQVQQDSISTEEEAENVEKQKSIFHWKNVCYEVRIKGESRQILNHVDGWVKPGTLTALMVRQSYFTRRGWN